MPVLSNQHAKANFVNFATLLIEELPNLLRQVFVLRWNRKYPGTPWRTVKAEQCSNGDAFLYGPEPFVPWSSAAVMHTKSAKAVYQADVPCLAPAGACVAVEFLRPVDGGGSDCAETDLHAFEPQTFTVQDHKFRKGSDSALTFTEPLLPEMSGRAGVHVQLGSRMLSPAALLHEAHNLGGKSAVKNPGSRAKMASGGVEQWGLTMLMFALLNASHKLVTEHADRELFHALERRVRPLRNTKFGHVGNLDLSDADYSSAKQAFRSVAEQLEHELPDIAATFDARIRDVEASSGAGQGQRGQDALAQFLAIQRDEEYQLATAAARYEDDQRRIRENAAQQRLQLGVPGTPTNHF